MPNLTTCGALFCAVTFIGCARQSTGEEGESGALGGGSAFGDGGALVNPIPGVGSSTTVAQGGTFAYAEDFVASNGLAPIDATKATALMNDPAVACSGWTQEPEAAGSVLEFVVDVSGSMDKTAPSTNGVTKWVATQAALKEALKTLPQGIPVGLTFFPNMPLYASEFPRPVAACVDTKDNVEIAPMDAVQKARLIAALNGIQMDRNGATPTHDAYNIALDELRATSEVGSKYLLLITDGQPTQSIGCIGNGMTCNPEPTQPVVEAIASAFKSSDPIKTFVVGSPGSEKNDCTNADVRDWLSSAARAGGTATTGCTDDGPTYCHFDLTNEALDFGKALTDSLDSIIQGIITCDYAVPPPPNGQTIDTSLVNLIYRNGDGSFSLLLPSKSDACQVGWHYTDTQKTKIHICEQTCRQLQNDSMAQVTLMFGCTQEQVNTPIL